MQQGTQRVTQWWRQKTKHGCAQAEGRAVDTTVRPRVVINILPRKNLAFSDISA